ncbi:HAD family hydrolase [Yoonia algicola]|uniref:HAD-IA family hydrolase n=1 Tax=Yoonia algicola TaxID=3137368 RepID=A0AAN0MCD5_9RHOB
MAGYDSGHGGKPAPGQLLAFCAETGLDADHCVMVGDSTHDLRAGRAAGMRTIGVLTGPAPREELLPLADVVLPSIGDIPGWLHSENLFTSLT